MTTNAQHTPGPWVAVTWDCDPAANEDGNRYWGIKPEIFAYGKAYLEASGWMTEANARLIAAAPELLEALKAAASMLPTETCERHGITAAILKATGEPSCAR